MKLNKNFWARMIPIFIIVVVTVILSLMVYRNMLMTEEETCWTRLEIATESTAQKIQVRLNDNISFLEAISDSYIFENHLTHESEVSEYLDSIVSNTIFESIDVVLSDRVITHEGTVFEHSDYSFTYDEIVERGNHISSRVYNETVGGEVMYCFIPIQNKGTVTGVLCGTLKCEALSEIFEVFTYRGQSQLYLIDCNDGNYLIDNWHDELGNIYDNQYRTGLDGEQIDLATPIMNRESGRMAFVSDKNGQNSYQCIIPVEGYNWELCVVVQEDIVFQNLNNLSEFLIYVGFFELLVILAYVIWNVYITVSATKNEEKAKELELTRATNEAKARFMSNMSHDIRTPLNGIVGMLHIINNHRDDEAVVNDCLRKIETSTQYLSTLTNDMLDINEIESDKVVLENQPIDLKKLVEALSVVIEPKLQSSSVSFNVDCSALKNPRVMGSAVHIERVMINLITNAIKYSKPQGGEVSFTVDDSFIDDGRSLYRFVVKDNGIGISEEFRESMYTPFAQEKVTARSSYQGYGLGLTIVYRLVEKMNGKIELESEKDVGSTFTVLIPLEHDTVGAEVEPTEPIVTDLSGINILLAEDNEFNREIAEVILTDVGASIVTAFDGKEAVETFESSKPFEFDLILMDIMMPELDGCEATEIIRAMNRPDAESIPIFAMTASTFTDEIERCKSVGMNEHIAKPLDINKLIRKVAKYCSKNKNNLKEAQNG